MYERDKKRLKRKINWLIASGQLLKKHKIYIYGINDRAHEIIPLLRLRGFRVENIIDNDPKKHGLYFKGIRTITLRELTEIEYKNNRFLLDSAFWKEMYRQLVKAGVPKRNIIVLEKAGLGSFFPVKAGKILIGRRIYQRITAGAAADCIFLICPYTGTGDIYLIGTLLPAYCQCNGITNYRLIVVNAACRKVARLFSIPQVVQLNGVVECGYLMDYYLCCPEECRLTILNDSWASIYTNPTQWVRGLNGLNFTEMFRRFVFRLPETVRPEPPILQDAGAEIQRIFQTHNLVRGKTVVLSPYSNTLADLPDSFWVSLAKRLLEKGYTVCTNSTGAKEPAIVGTKGVFFPLNIAPQVITAAGGFVGIRSGFCDVISAAKATKVILYDRANFFFNCRAYEYFSLREMGLCEDAIELEYDVLHEEKILEMTMACF